MVNPPGGHAVRPLPVDRQDSEQIKEKYEEIYRASDVWLYKKSHGVHSIIYSLLEDRLPGSRVLDIGCGAGRLAIMCAHRAAATTGFDFSQEAIAIARLNAACAGQAVDFAVADIEAFCRTTSGTYDLITLVGVLEHVPDPVATLRDISRITSAGGTLVVSCPNFINARGFAYMTLLTLFRLPMSLVDVRQVDYMDMERWSGAAGYRLEGTTGAIYRFGWEEKAAADLIKRVPLAVRDAGLNVSVDFAAFNAWQEKMTRPARQLLGWLEGQGVLGRIERKVEIRLERRGEIDDALWVKMQQYMHEDIVSDPYYSSVPPFSTMGGECIYVLRKA
jgi:2-polyprenyl-6-hydroxyphenyl methylase / 3-demethylubiquinone-9 3-methyltransferase